MFDLPEIPRLDCVEHWIQKRRCECGHLPGSSFPAGVSAPACYGPRIRALGICLVCYQHLPVARAAEILSDWVRAPISVATLQAFVTQGADGLDGFLEEIRGQLQGADVAHFDETGARVDGRLSWIHCASTDQLTLYTLHAKRGRDGIDAAGVLIGFEGTAVHDGWAPYRLYEKARHALCGAHHLRELLGAEEQGASLASAMSALLLDAKDAVERAIAAGKDHLGARPPATIRECYRDVIALGYEQNPGLKPAQAGRRPKRTKAQNLLLRLDQHEREVLRFATDFRVPFDNNLCERDLRMVKLQQKISGCWRTREGAERFLAIRSYTSTARKHGQRPAEVLTGLAGGQPWLPLAAGP
ncbi:MAG: IS66 family transposase [Solirubrobacteraceae bacterium]